MTEDESFLRTILGNPDDQFVRLVYADWLDDRADPRAEYVRLRVRVAELPFGHADRPALRERMLTLQGTLPSWWLMIAGGIRATASAPDPARIEAAAHILKRPVKRTVNDYDVTIEAAAISGLTGTIAFLESWSKWNDNYHDITYYLRLRDPAGRETSCEPQTYNPYFGCRVQFMEWYGDSVLMIYEEKHETYACRFGFDSPPLFSAVDYKWILDYHEVAYRGYGDTEMSRLSFPGLEKLPPLSEAEARERDLWAEL